MLRSMQTVSWRYELRLAEEGVCFLAGSCAPYTECAAFDIVADQH